MFTEIYSCARAENSLIKEQESVSNFYLGLPRFIVIPNVDLGSGICRWFQYIEMKTKNT